MKRLLITGTRLGWDENQLKRALRRALEDLRQAALDDLTDGDPTVILVHGNAVGVDRQARDIWREWGLPDEPHTAQWSKYRDAAGPLRNTTMVRLGADLCLAFIHPESKGTLNCLAKAEAKGIPTRKYYTTDNARKGR